MILFHDVLFVHRALMEYSEEGSQIHKRYGKNYRQLPVILAGDFIDFNINFNDKKSKTFFMETFNLRMTNNPSESTTRDDTTIDADFSR